jgi:hypothetical protein
MATESAGKPGSKAAKRTTQASGARAASTPARASGGDAASRHRKFLHRVLSNAKIAGYLLAATLCGGTLGYHFIAGLSWLISFHQASLLLSGMGPVETDLTDAGRLFESFYSIFCGVMLLGSTGILFTPVIHRILHAFHVEDAGPGGK